MKRFLWLGAVLVLFAICSGCGDVFRPIIIPNPIQFPNPQAAHTVVTISDNGTVVNGSAMVIDVSGDTDVSQKNTGLRPVHAVQQTGNVMLVVNQSDSSSPQDSLSKLTFSGVTIGNVTTVTLPASYDPNPPHNLSTSAPNFVATTESNQAYVSMPQYQPNQNGAGTFPITPVIAVISTVQNTIVATIPVGTTPNAYPVAIAETPNQQKLYVANYGDSSLNAFNTIDRSARGLNGTFTSPLWISARNDSQQVYVLGNGVVSTIDTTTTSGPDNVIATINVPSAERMWYDTILNRLYIPGGGAITILDVSQSVPSVITGAPIVIPTALPTTRTAGDPCATTATEPLSVVAVTSLPDGSRAYVGSYYTDGADNVCPQVTVINASTNTIKTTIPVPGFPNATDSATAYYVPACAATRDGGPLAGSGFRFNMAAGGDSTRAYLSSCDGGNVNIIDTTIDAYALNDPAPNSARPPIPPSTQNPPQNPVFMLAGP